MSSASTREIGKEFIKAFITEVIQSVKIESVLFDKDRLLRAVKKIEYDTFEAPSSRSDLEEEKPVSEPISLLEDIPYRQEKAPTPSQQIPAKQLQQSQPTQTLASQSASSLQDLLTSSSGKSFLDEALPKVNRHLMIKRRVPRPPPAMLRVPVPKLPLQHHAQVSKKEESKSKEIHPAAPTMITVQALGKINNLLLDPTVQSIECPGPGKQVTVYRSGFIQNANISLTTDEINKIMIEISEKTKIPIIPGIFKAALGNFIMTSVISEFVGTRFIIQKKELSKLE